MKPNATDLRTTIAEIAVTEGREGADRLKRGVRRAQSVLTTRIVGRDDNADYSVASMHRRAVQQTTVLEDILRRA